MSVSTKAKRVAGVGLSPRQVTTNRVLPVLALAGVLVAVLRRNS